MAKLAVFGYLEKYLFTLFCFELRQLRLRKYTLEGWGEDFKRTGSASSDIFQAQVNKPHKRHCIILRLDVYTLTKIIASGPYVSLMCKLTIHNSHKWRWKIAVVKYTGMLPGQTGLKNPAIQPWPENDLEGVTKYGPIRTIWLFTIFSGIAWCCPQSYRDSNHQIWLKWHKAWCSWGFKVWKRSSWKWCTQKSAEKDEVHMK